MLKVMRMKYCGLGSARKVWRPLCCKIAIFSYSNYLSISGRSGAIGRLDLPEGRELKEEEESIEWFYQCVCNTSLYLFIAWSFCGGVFRLKHKKKYLCGGKCF